MPALARPRPRTAVGLALSLLGVLSLTGAMFAPVAGADPPGNNGTIKIDGLEWDDHPNNEPHPGCIFQVDFYGFDEGDLYAQVEFSHHPPTGDRETLLTDEVFIGEDSNDGGGSEAGLDASKTYDLTSLLAGKEPHDKQGYHVRLDIHADGSQGADVKHKMFWVGPCEAEEETGSLTVTKTVVDGDNDLAFSFEVDCDDDAFDTSFTLKHGETRTIDDIPVGTVCEVTEDAVATYTTAVSPADGTVTIDADGETVAFTNTGPPAPPETGSLTVTKTVVNGSTTQVFEFEVDCDDDAFDDTFTLTHGQSRTIADIPVGTVCEVTEDAVATYTTTVSPADGTVTIDADGETVAFTNTGPQQPPPPPPVTGSLTVTKTVVNGTGNPAFSFDVDCNGDSFDATFTLKHGETRTIAGIPVGTVCEVTEDAVGSYTTTVSPANGTVTVDADGETVAFTNTRQLGGGGGEDTEVGGEVIERPVEVTVPVNPGVVVTPVETPEVAAEVVETAPTVLGAQITRPAPQPAQVRAARLARTGPSEVSTLLAVAGFSLLIGGALVLLQGRLTSPRRRLTV